MRTFIMKSTCPYEIADDEPDISCEFTVFSSEKQTRDYPGIRGYCSLGLVTGVDRELNDFEFNRIMEECHEDLERQAEEEIDRIFEETGISERKIPV